MFRRHKATSPNFVTFEVLKLAIKQDTVFRDVTMCGMVQIYRRSRRTCGHHQPRSSETKGKFTPDYTASHLTRYFLQ